MLQQFHVCIQVSDLHRSQCFYQQLGFTPVADMQQSGVGYEQFTAYAGYKQELSDIFTIDYALTDIGDNSIAPYSHIFSLKLNITRKQESSSESISN